MICGHRQPQRPGQKRGEATGPNPVERGKLGSKYHLLVDRQGIPLAVQLSAANAHDSTYLECTDDAIQRIFGPPGKPGRPLWRLLHLGCAVICTRFLRRAAG